MAETSEKSFPFDAEMIDDEYDRVYLADDFARYFRSFISSGTFMREPTNLQIISNDDMSVTLKPGSMIIDGYRYDNVSDIIIQLQPADGVLDRIDRISMTWDKSERDIHCVLQQGEYSYEPIAPECRRNAEYKDYVVAEIYVKAGVVKIEQSDIVDTRLDDDVCGLAAPFTELDTSTLYAQLQGFYEKVIAENEEWQNSTQGNFEAWCEAQKESFSRWYTDSTAEWDSQFWNWFDNLKSNLEGNVEANILNMIGTLSNLNTESKDNLVNAINEVEETRKVKTFSSVTQIGLEVATNTMLEVFKAMPNCSALTIRGREITDAEGKRFITITKEDDVDTGIEDYGTHTVGQAVGHDDDDNGYYKLFKRGIGVVPSGIYATEWLPMKPDMLQTIEELEANTGEGSTVDATIVKEIHNNMGGFAFYNNPTVVFVIADNVAYTDESGAYVLSDSDTGAQLLADTDTYCSAVLEGNYYSIGGADTVSPFKGGKAAATTVTVTATSWGGRSDGALNIQNDGFTKMTLEKANNGSSNFTVSSGATKYIIYYEDGTNSGAKTFTTGSTVDIPSNATRFVITSSINGTSSGGYGQRSSRVVLE